MIFKRKGNNTLALLYLRLWLVCSNLFILGYLMKERVVCFERGIDTSIG
jgi:hypothetical protein